MSKIETNKALATRLGWSPESFGQVTIDDALVAKIAAYQAERELTPDGLMGPRTYAVMLTSIIRGALTRTLTLEERGALVAIEAKRRWLLGTRDDANPINRAAIQALIASSSGLGWSWVTYEGDGSFEWCGAFAAACWSAAGLGIAARYTYFASTFRLDAWGAYKRWQPESPPNNPPKPPTPPRLMIKLDERSTAADARFPDGTLPRAGDILLVGGAHTGPGRHITIIESFDPTGGTFRTIEGNAYGFLPDATRGQGIIQATRAVGLGPGLAPTAYHARRVIRPGPADVG
jgi:hypothetical protein